MQGMGVIFYSDAQHYRLARLSSRHKAGRRREIGMAFEMAERLRGPALEGIRRQ